MKAELKQLATYVNEQHPVYTAVKQEAKDKAVSVSRVLFWALQERYQRQARQAGMLLTDTKAKEQPQ